MTFNARDAIFNLASALSLVEGADRARSLLVRGLWTIIAGWAKIAKVFIFIERSRFVRFSKAHIAGGAVEAETRPGLIRGVHATATGETGNGLVHIFCYPTAKSARGALDRY